MSKIAKVVFALLLITISRLAYSQSGMMPVVQDVPPAFGDVTVTSIVPNDDSAKVTIDLSAIPGAKDFRIIRVAHPNIYKYSGGSDTVEVNGIDPVNGSDCYIEVLDALGPFQDMDPYLVIDPGMIMHVNGQGDESAVPNVLAVSEVFHVTPVARFLTGAQAFFDTFHVNQPLVAIPSEKLDPLMWKEHHPRYQRYENDKWAIELMDHSIKDSRVFFMSTHFMDILYDYNATLRGKTLMRPLQKVTLAPGQVLHLTFEVDSFFTLNRVCGLLVFPKGTSLIYKKAGGNPTKDKTCFDWKIDASVDVPREWHGTTQTVLMGYNKEPNPGRWKGKKTDPFGGNMNGNDQNLDFRHHFDLYLSSKRVMIYEEGILKVRTELTQVKSKAGPISHTLDWLNKGPLEIAFYHYLYHSAADLVYMRNGLFPFRPAYWMDHRPSSDERHWDNMGFEVLTDFPAY